MEDENFILKGYQIDEVLFAIIVNPGVINDEGKDDLPGGAVFYWVNKFRNSVSLNGVAYTGEKTELESTTGRNY